MIEIEAIECHRQHRREKYVEQIGGMLAALAEALANVHPLQYLAVVRAYACPHTVV